MGAEQHPHPPQFRATPATAAPPEQLAVPATAWAHLWDLLAQGRTLEPNDCEACEQLHDAILVARRFRVDGIAARVRVRVRRSDLVGRISRVQALPGLAGVEFVDALEVVIRFGPYEHVDAEREARIAHAVERAGLAVLALTVDGGARA